MKGHSVPIDPVPNQSAPHQPVRHWEYFITPLPVHTPGAILNNWGKQGWELVQIVTNEQGGSVAYMKRPLAAEGSI